MAYKKGSGQVLNQQKTAIMFNSNSVVIENLAILAAIESIICANFEKYLGLLVLVGKEKQLTFKWLKEKILQKLNNWKNNFLSQSGREVLIKAVLQATPVYTMSLYKLPKSLISKIESLMAMFW